MTNRRPRVGLALVALVLLASLAVAYRPPRGLPGSEPSAGAIWVLLIPLGAVAVGLLRGRRWAADVGIAVGLAVLPWGTLLTFASGPGVPRARAAMALLGSVVLLGALRGSEGGGAPDTAHVAGPPGAPARGWVRWSLILNLVSALNLYLFVVAYSFGASWQLVVLGSLLAGILLGSILLARGKTMGLLVLALSGALMVPGAAAFVRAEAGSVGEAVLFALLVTPGVVAALGAVGLLAGPLVGLLRERD